MTFPGPLASTFVPAANVGPSYSFYNLVFFAFEFLPTNNAETKVCKKKVLLLFPHLRVAGTVVHNFKKEIDFWQHFLLTFRTQYLNIT